MADISRREALKRGATIGAGVLWATPAVQAVSMVRSAAAATSPPPGQPTYYAAKVEETGCSDIWNQIGRDTDAGAPTGKCLTPNKGNLTVVPGGCNQVVSFTTPAEGSPWTITLAPGCEIIGDECFVYVKASTDCLKDPAVRNGQTWTFKNPASNNRGISHIEFVICCTPAT